MQTAPQDIQLMPKPRVLSLKPQLRLEWRNQDGQNEKEQPYHSASLGDSIAASRRIGFSVHTGADDVMLPSQKTLARFRTRVIWPTVPNRRFQSITRGRATRVAT